MDNKSVTKELDSLIRMDIDAMNAYAQAIKHVDFTPIREKLEQFLEEHEQHAVNLSNIVQSLGEEPPELSRDFKGFFIEGFTSLLSITGIRMALEAMRMNEKLINKRYAEACELELPSNIKQIVEKQYNDERRHLVYLEEALASRLWEKE